MGERIPQCFTQCMGECFPQCFTQCLGECFTQPFTQCMGERFTQRSFALTEVDAQRGAVSRAPSHQLELVV